MRIASAIPAKQKWLRTAKNNSARVANDIKFSRQNNSLDM